MSDLNFQKKKEIARQIATLLSSEENWDIYNKFRMIIDDSYSKSTIVSPFSKLKNLRMKCNNEEVVEHIGIWSPNNSSAKQLFIKTNGTENRYPGSPYLWSDNQEILQKKTDKKRILLIGESIARGFVLDPVFTPAEVLKNLLFTSIEPDSLEVIDLACTGIGASDLLQLIRSSMQLKPDIVILMAGNNWWNSY